MDEQRSGAELTEALKRNTQASRELAAELREASAARRQERVRDREWLRVRAESGDVQAIEVLDRLADLDPFWRDDA